uniref:Fibrinogen C-terminal domain-containing protein n=1 Tax=Ascaris lumbricoides TaxID=6252 RepID=A0A9J2PHW2_ASCLU
MRLLSLITLVAVYQWAIAAPLFDGIKFPLKRAQTKAIIISSTDFNEIRERIVKIVENVTKYSGKVQNGISKMDVERNKLNGESSATVAKQKQLADGRHALEQRISAVNKEMATTNEQLQQTIDQVAKVLNEARRRRSNAVRIIGEREARLNNLRQHLSDLQSALARNRQESDQCKEKLLKSTHLTETVLQLLKDLSSLQLNVIHLKEELQARQDLDNEDLGIGWESINTPLNVISNYLSNGGFVKDLAGWGIDIKAIYFRLLLTPAKETKGIVVLGLFHKKRDLIYLRSYPLPAARKSCQKEDSVLENLFKKIDPLFKKQAFALTTLDRTVYTCVLLSHCILPGKHVQWERVWLRTKLTYGMNGKMGKRLQHSSGMWWYDDTVETGVAAVCLNKCEIA